MPGVDDAIVVRGPLEKNFKIGGLQRWASLLALTLIINEIKQT